MESRKEALGLRIRYNLMRPSLEEDTIGNDLLTVSVRVEKGSLSRDFITSPEIREAIAKSRLKEGAGVGSMAFERKALGRQLCSTSYYPLPTKNGGSPFIKKGIASLIESRAIERAKKMFPEARLMTHMSPSELRIAQIRKRGLTFSEITEGAPLEKYRNAMRQKLAADLKKARKARRRAP